MGSGLGTEAGFKFTKSLLGIETGAPANIDGFKVEFQIHQIPIRDWNILE